MSHLDASSSGILPVALLAQDGAFTLVKPVRVAEELAVGSHCAGLQVGTLRFFGENDTVGTPVKMDFQRYLKSYKSAAQEGAVFVNLTNRSLNYDEIAEAFVFSEQSQQNTDTGCRSSI